MKKGHNPICTPLFLNKTLKRLNTLKNSIYIVHKSRLASHPNQLSSVLKHRFMRRIKTIDNDTRIVRNLINLNRLTGNYTNNN